MDGRLAKRDSAVKMLQNIENNTQNHTKDMNKQNKMMLNLSEKTSTRQELNKIKKIKKSNYDPSVRDASSVSS